MKISTKGRYGARASLDLAIMYGSGPALVREIAENQDISEPYLEHIFNTLRSCGIVKSTRGANGGFELSRDPSAINLGEIVKTLEGPVEIVSCTNDSYYCAKISHCVLNQVWVEVKKSIEDILERISLEDLVKRHHDMQKYDVGNQPEYYI